MNSIRDANLYTLVARPRPTNPSYAFSLTDLVEPSFNADGRPSEGRRRYYLLRDSASSAFPNAYRLELRDAYSDAVLASVEAPMRDADPPTPPSKPASMSLIDREREAALAAVIAPEQEPAAKKKAKERKEDEGKPWWKHRRRDLRLYEPEVPLEFENSGGISFEWSFVYEECVPPHPFFCANPADNQCAASDFDGGVRPSLAETTSVRSIAGQILL